MRAVSVSAATTNAAGLSRGPLASGPTGVDPGAEVEAMSELVGELSREIAAAVRALPDAPKDAPPGPWRWPSGNRRRASFDRGTS